MLPYKCVYPKIDMWCSIGKLREYANDRVSILKHFVDIICELAACRLKTTVKDKYKSLDQSQKKTKLAYVDAVAKPPRGVKK